MPKFKIRFSRCQKVSDRFFPSKVVTVEAEDKFLAYHNFLRRMERVFPQSNFLITSIRDESGCYVYMLD